MNWTHASFGAIVSRSILVRQLVSATREELWSACATARGLSNWQADVAHGDAAVGQSISLIWPTLHLNLKLQVVELVPQERIVYSVGATRLTMEIEPGQIRLTHEGLRSEDEEDGTRSAWRTSLGLLAHSLTHHSGHERQVRWVTRSIKVSAPIAHLFFTQPVALEQWFCRYGEIGHEGTEVDLQLRGGELLTGEVLANTPDRDVAFTWREQNQSCLVLRSFPSPSDPEERLVALCWSRWGTGAFPEDTVTHFGHAFDRLARLLNRKGLA
jgi:uncharacterized protein YndB with AHSA1/START domain